MKYLCAWRQDLHDCMIVEDGESILQATIGFWGFLVPVDHDPLVERSKI
jgi:hypothetical protein